MRKLVYFFLLAVLALTLVACGGGDDGGSDTTKAGEELFAQAIIGSQAGCSTCHSLTPDEVIVGPSLAGIGGRSNEAAIRESILDPEAVLVDDFPTGTMPQVWESELSAEQLDNLVAYLLTLK
ncbi:MAG: cytochrome c [Chloroflexi bacterium]|nr:cytochrome c [Chloroflexota bacterium]